MISVPAIICPRDGCSVLQLTGTVTIGAVTLDPAFDMSVPAAQVSAQDAAGAEHVQAFDANNALVEDFRFDADGPYRINMPIASAAAQSIRTLRISTAGSMAVRHATVHGEPGAEALAASAATVIFAWNAQQFPAIRISMHYRPGSQVGHLPLSAAGSESYQQLMVATAADHLVVDFSDGVRSARQTYAVFGR